MAGEKNFENRLKFQPTRPLRGATILGTALHTGIEISTHAPLAGRDEE